MATITTLTRDSEPPARPALRTVPPAADAREVDLSIAIVTWNSERWIERCLRAIPAACEGIAYEVVLHDNASADTTLRRLDADSVQILRADRNLGFAAGMNRAIAATRGRYVFLLNPDCEVAPHALTVLFRFLESHPGVAAAAPLLSDESGRSQREFQFRRLPTLRSFIHEVLLLDKMFPRNGATAHYRYRDLDLDQPKRIEQPAAAALLIRREVFDEVGPLDELFEPAWFEDVDYCARLAAADKEVYAVPAAWARHFGGASLEHISFGDFTDIWYRNMFRYAVKWLPAGQTDTLRRVIILGMLLRIPVALLGFGHPDLSRWETTRAYLRVLKKAFKRWGGSSQSSS